MAYAQQCIADRYSELPLFDSSQIVIQHDLSYGSANHFLTGVEVDLQYNIYYPDPEIDTLSLRPLVVLTHGGSFMAGNKDDMNYQCMELARRGFVAVSVGYRLGWRCGGADFLQICLICGGLSGDLRRAVYCAVQDHRAAMRHLLDNATVYKIDPQWIFTGGESAGSITTMLSQYWTQADAAAFIPNFSSTAGGLDSSGNSSTSTYEVRGMLNTCGAVNSTAVVQDNPLPTIHFHDEADCVVPFGCAPVMHCLCTSFFSVCGSSVIHSTLNNLGVCSELHIVPGSINHCSYPVNSRIQKSACFMNRLMCGICTSLSNTDVYAATQCSPLTSTETGYAGCTYADAINYDPQATFDDGSCTFNTVLPCPADFNTDHVVNVADLLLFLGMMGCTW